MKPGYRRQNVMAASDEVTQCSSHFEQNTSDPKLPFDGTKLRNETVNDIHILEPFHKVERHVNKEDV